MKKHPYTNEESLPNRIIDNVFTTIVIIAFCSLCWSMVGCSTFGNEKIDLPVEVSVSYEDNFGNVYTADVGPDGTKLYISARGDFYSLDEDGFSISAPDGIGGTTTVRVKRVANTDKLDTQHFPEDAD